MFGYIRNNSFKEINLIISSNTLLFNISSNQGCFIQQVLERIHML